MLSLKPVMHEIISVLDGALDYSNACDVARQENVRVTWLFEGGNLARTKLA